MGHEGVGYIERIHPSAEGKGFAVGDAIGWEYFVGCCFECEGCLVHNLNCERASGQVLVQGFQTDGYFQEYSIIDYRNAIILPKELDMDRSAPLFCAGMTGMRPPQLKAYDTVLIRGSLSCR